MLSICECGYAFKDEHGQLMNRNINAKRLTKRTIDELIGICKGIQSDGIVSKEEVEFLTQWLENNKNIIDIWPVNILAKRIEKIVADNIITEEEKKDLFELLTEITGGTKIETNIASMSTLLPIDDPQPDIFFEDKIFCFTGKFFYGPRYSCETAVLVRNGRVQPRITQTTNYVVIGIVGSSDWLHSTHGTKIEYAVKLREKGFPISIVSEEHWTKYLEKAQP
jgi:NAD-dependent DNA ligase